MKASNPQAFPDAQRGGMTLRDYFAAKAMQGSLSASERNGPWKGDRGDRQHLACWAYAVADEMLRERERSQQ